jgi:hypothetical protein
MDVDAVRTCGPPSAVLAHDLKKPWHFSSDTSQGEVGDA